ncbi:hypothetical protein [Chryseosolibacter indicus]|uniref:Uncharacterized protein n=1 Tax=Chryseosolibacter indicus TaxID=2782351 RepID=A0ABS5VPT1_9BACT|nr:hypothetical protein [Chryseosolibacter indicus]MBT1703457.1 hypothetical protein [Chryseosolibacter indicus]
MANPFTHEAFHMLDQEERDFMLKLPLLVCILIAGADGNIDRKEIKGAIQTAEKNNKRFNTIWGSYFTEVSKDFEDKLKVLILEYPYESTQRNPLIIDELSKINTIWTKLDAAIATSFYQILQEFAAKVASSSGGWLGLGSIGTAEARLVKLPMILDPGKI